MASAPARTAAQATPGGRDARWAQIRRVFGQEGEEEDGYFRVQFPRTDLRVRIGAVTLEPAFELTSYFGFAPVKSTDVLAMGEVVARQDEVGAALREARRQGVSVTAVHNHLLDETPRIVYLHLMAEGPAAIVATKLRSVLSTTGAPLKPAKEKETGKTPDWSAIDAVLGKHEEAEGRTVEYEFPRHESHSVHGVPVKSSGLLETGSEVVFQQLGDGRVACGGELYLLPAEVEPVMDALERAGLHVTALHNHMLDESPTMYWMHWYGTGSGPALARGVANALSHMNGARRAGG
jgi:hypothetical protein